MNIKYEIIDGKYKITQNTQIMKRFYEGAPTSLKKSKDDTKKLLNLNDESITTQDNTVVIQFRTQSFDSL